MRSDVMGTRLSGGLDSSSMKRFPLKCPGNAGGKFSDYGKIHRGGNDESHFAAMVVTHHVELDPFFCSYEDFAATISDVTRVQEEPLFADCDAVPRDEGGGR